MKVLQKSSVVLKLTEEEATVLCALAGGVPFNFDTRAGVVLRDLFNALNDSLPNRSQSFTDFFEGEVRSIR